MNTIPKHKGVIFDMDLTLVDSSIASADRQVRNWPKVYSLIPQFIIYPGVLETFNYIKDNKIKVAIVSTAPRPYIERIVNHFSMPVNVIVGYHDANRIIKPKPDQMILAVSQLGFNANEVISFGDRLIDIEASYSAGIESIACYWGTEEANLLDNSSCTSRIKNALEMIDLI